jgi:hypothetical protein
MTNNDLVARIASLLSQAGAAHHEYEQTVLQGVYDQDWPLWYARYAVEQGLNSLLNMPLNPEQVSQLLTQIYQDYESEKPQLTWAEYTAEKLVERAVG